MTDPEIPEDDIACRHLVEELTAYVEETMPAPERRRFDAHLAYCEECGTYVAQMRATVARLGSAPEEPLAADRRRAVLDAFRDWRERSG